MKTEFRWSIGLLVLTQGLLLLGVLADLPAGPARAFAIKAQLMSTGNLGALFALSLGMVRFAAAETVADKKGLALQMVVWGGLKLAFLTGLILFLALQPGGTIRGILWGISPWVAAPLAVGVGRVLRKQRRKKMSGVASED